VAARVQNLLARRELDRCACIGQIVA
jgi:hypothetical protein